MTSYCLCCVSGVDGAVSLLVVRVTGDQSGGTARPVGSHVRSRVHRAAAQSGHRSLPESVRCAQGR